MFVKLLGTACLALVTVLALPAIDLNDQDHNVAQVSLDICPQLSVRCVADGDWMHPIGYLGKRRM